MASAYKYTIPLDRTGGSASPVHSIVVNGDLLKKHYKAQNLILVQTKASPHYHKDSVNVQVEEVDKSEYEN